MSTKPTAAPLPAVAAAAAGQRLAPSVEAAVAAAAEAGAVTSSTPAPVAGGAGVAAAVLAGGQVVSVEGSAWLQVPGQAPQPLSAGATVPPGAVMLAAADAVVRLSRPQSLGAKMAAKGGLDKLIADFDKGAGETAPAAGVAGGDETTAEGGLRVDRVSEATTTAGLGTSGSGGSGTGAEFPTAGTAGGTPDGTTPTPSPSIVLDNPGLTGDATPRISGSTDLAPGSLVTVTVTDANGQVQVITATVGSDGRFAVDPAPLPDGNFSINVQAENTTVTTGGTVDTTPPTLRLDPVAITGDNTPAISGQSNLPAGSTVTVTVVDATGKSQELTATIGSDGRFSVSPGQNLSDGRYTVQVVATDAAGNAQTNTTNGVVDTKAPSVSVDAPDLSNSQQPTVTGRTDLPSGTPIDVKITDANGQTQTTQATVRPDGSFSLTPSTPLPDGQFTVEVTGRDAAGNPSTSTSTGTVDSTAPLSPSMGSVVDDQGPIQGQLNPGGATDDSRPTFNGTAEPGSTITIYTNGVPIGTAPVGPNGTWSFTPEVPLPAGPNSITTTATDPAGNTGPSSQPFALTVDVGAPQVPSIISATDNVTPVEGLLTKGSGTNDNTPTINGTGRPGETVTLFADGQPVGSVVVNAKGEWSITPSPLADKTWNFTAEAVNIHGVHSPVTGAWPLTIDTQAPRQVAVDTVTDNVGPVRGEITEGSTTDDATPTWQGKNAEPGSTITVYDKGVALGSTTVAPDGTWRFTPPVALPDGPHSLSITATDAVGNVSPATPPLNFSIDTSQVSSPSIDSVTEAGVAGEVPMAFNQASNDTTPTLSGSSKPNQVVQVFDGETLLGQTVADANGQWRFTPSTPLPDGPHDFVAVSLNAAGVPSEPSNAFRVVVDTVAPDAPPSLLISDDVGRVQGSLQNGDSTDDNTPTFSGSGANTGDTITVLDGGQPVGTTVVKPDGTWTLTPLTPLTPGAHQFTLTATDPAGNTSAPSAPFALTIDIAPPDAPTIGGIFDNTGAVVGELAPGATTDDAKPTVWGSAEPGSTVEVFDGDTLLGRATTGPDGYWTFTPTLPLLLGEHEITARAVDAAGNTSAASAPRDFNLMDDAPPSAPAIVNVIDDQGTVQGHVAKSTGITDDTQPSIRGTAEPGAVITVRDGTTVLGTVNADSSGRWAFTPPTPLADGPHAITVTATNAAGNVSTPTGIYDFVVDTQNPDAPNSVIALDNVGPVVGAISNGQTTDDATPSLSGTGEPGATVTLYDGGSPIGTVVVKPDGTWQFTPTTPLLDGAHSLSTTQTDVAGNTGPASAPTTFTLDTKDVVAPTITALRDDTGSVQGTVQADGVTDDTRPTLQGTAPAGTTVSVYDGTTLLGTVPADSAGRWAFTPSTPLADGPHVLSATATNAAGVVSPATAPYAVTVDTQGPAVPTITGLGDDVGSVQGALDEAARTDDTTPTLSGTGEPGATIKVYDGSDLIGTATVDPDGRWTLTPATPLTEGPHSFTATATDPAGNTGPASPAQTLVVDLTATAAPTLAIAEDANDNGVVNLAELSGKVDITIGLPAGARVGDVLNLTTSSGNQSLTITAEQLAAGQVLTQVDAPASGESLIARVTLTDAAGNTSASAGDAAAFDYKTPDASTTALVINPVSADNIVNAAEADQTLQVTGQAQGEFSTGDTVTLNINGKSFTGIVAQDGSFSIAVPGADLAADPDHTVAGSLRATDPAGNQADIGAMRVFSVDTAATGAPTVTLVEDANNDGFINRAELNGLVIARVDLPQGAAVGDRVDISNGEVTNSIVLTAQDLSAGHVLTGFVAPPTGSTVAITATLTDVAGNTSAQGSDSARIDTSGPSSATTGISINPLTADNVINAAEAGGTVQVTGQATGEFTPGDVVTLSANGKTFTGTLGADGSFSVAVPGADLVADGDKTLDVAIRITDPAGNQADIPATRAYSVDTTATGTPTVTIAEDANNNGFISRAELNGVVDVRVDLPAGSVAGDSLSVSNGSTTSTFTLTPEQIAAGVVNTSFAAPAEGQLVQITAILTDMAGNASPQGSDAARIDTTGPSGGPGGTTGLVLDSLSADNVINAAEAGDSVRITGHATGEFTAGDTVTVEINGQSFSGQVAADGSFSIPVPGAELAVDPDKTVQASLRATDPAGNQADIAASRAYGVDISATGAPTVAIAEDTNSNGFISSAELNGVVDVRVGLPAGTVAGDTLTVSNGSTTASFVVSAAHLAAGFINTSFAAPAEGQTVNITAILTDIAGNASPQGTDAARIDTTGPSSATTGITINPVSADNIVNAADAAGTVHVTGQATGEFTPGDVVTLTANGKTFTGTLGADGSFSVAVPGADLVADGDQTLDVSIRITDPAGNQADIPATRAYSVDTAATGAPTVTIAEDANNNGFISSAELNGVVDVRVGLPAGTVAGDTLTVSNGTTTTPITVTAAHLAAGFVDTSFAAPADGQMVNITAILTDIAGNASPQGTDAARIDTTGPSSATTGITINPVSADNIVNAAEAAGTVNVTGQATGEFTPGDVVTLTANGKTFTGTLGADGSFSVAVPGADLVADGDQTLDIAIRITDPAGNQADIPATRAYSVDTAATGAPTVTISEDANNNGFISRAELNGVVDVRVGLPAGTVAGDTLTVSNGTTTTPITVTAAHVAAGFIDTSFAAPADGQMVNITAILTDIAGNASPQGTDAARMDTTGPSSATTGITINPVSADNIVSAAEAAGPVHVTGQATGEFTPGDVVTLTANGKTFTGTLGADGSFSVAVPGADLVADGDQTLDVSIRITDPAGNQADIPATRAYSVDTAATGAPTVTIAEDANNNGFISRAELNGVVDVRVGLPAGTVAGDTLTVSNGSTTASFVVTAAQLAAGFIDTSFAAPAEGQTVNITAILTDIVGNASPQGTDAARIDTTGPSSATTGITINPVSADNIVNAADAAGTVHVTGQATGEFTPGDVVTLTANGKTFTGTLGADGSFSVAVPGADLVADGDQTLDVSIRITDPAGNQADIPATRAYSVDTAATGAPTVTIAEDANNNGFISSAELNGVVDVRVALPAGTVAGDTLTVSNGSTTASFVVSAAHLAAGFINTSFAAPAEGQTVNITAILTDIAGNASPQGTDAARIDTTGPSSATTGITINPVSADNIVNAAEAAGTVNVTGQATGEFTPGDVVMISVNGHIYSSVIGQNGSFSVAVAGGDLAADADQRLDVTLQATDPAGNVHNVSVGHGYSVDATQTVQTTGDDTASRTVATPDGGYWLLFTSNQSGGQDSYGLYAQRFDATGKAVSAINTLFDSTDPKFQIGHSAVGGLNQMMGYDATLGADNSLSVYFTAGASHVGYLSTVDANGLTHTPPTLVPSPAGFTPKAIVMDVEMQQNDTTVWESPPVIETLADGRFIAIWSNNGLSDNIQNMNLQARIFNADGSPSTDQFQVGSWAVDGTDGYDVDTFTVKQLAGGQVVVGYVRNYAETGGDEPVYSIIDPSLSSNWVVRADLEMQQHDTTLWESPPVIEALSDGRFIAIWANNGLSDDTQSMMLQARIFNADGSPSTDQFQVGSWAVDGTDGYDVDNFTVKELAGGEVVVGYVRNYAETGGDEPVYSIIDPSLSSNWVVQADLEMQQNDTTVWESPPVIEALADGRFIAIWANNGLSDDTQSMMLQARIFNADGSPSTDQFQVGSWAVDGTDGYDVDNFTVKELAGGEVVVGYVRNYAETGGDEPVYSIIDPSLSSNWVVRADLEMQQNDTTVWESPPVIEALADGRFIAVWANNGLSDDTQSMKLQARVFNADGSPSTDQFQVGTRAVDGTDGYDVDNITVRQLASGEVVVGYVRNYAEAGGDEPVFTILGLQGKQIDPTLVSLPSGGQSLFYAADTGTGYDIYQVRVGTDGQPLANSATKVVDGLSHAGFQQDLGAIAGSSTGKTYALGSDGLGATQVSGDVVALTYSDVRNGDANVYMRLVDGKTGAVIGTEMAIAQSSAGLQMAPEITRLDDTTVVATWLSNSGSNNLGGMDVFTRRFHIDPVTHAVTPLDATDQLVSLQTDQSAGLLTGTLSAHHATAALVGGGYVVAWSQGGDIHAQRFDGEGHRLGEEYVHTSASATDLMPSVVGLQDGSYALSWTTNSQAGDLSASLANSAHNGNDVQTVVVKVSDEPATGITVNPVSADNIVNAAEASGTVNVTGQASGEFTPGDVVTITANGKTFTGTLGADGSFTVAVPGADLVADGDKTLDVLVRITDPTGHQADIPASRTYSVNTSVAGAPTVTISEDANNNGFISRTELNGALDVRVGLPAGAVAGDTLTVSNGTTSTHLVLTAAQVSAGHIDTSFAAPIEGQMVTITATLTDVTGNTSPQGSDAARIDTTGPSLLTTGITVHPVSADNVVNAAEAAGPVHVTGRATGEFTPGDVVTITASGKTFTGTLGADGSFTVAVPGADLVADGDKTLAVSARVTDPAGNQADIPATRTYSVDTAATGAPTVTISEDANNNGFISRGELNGVVDVRVGLPAGTVAGDTLTVSNGSITTHFTVTAAHLAAGFLNTSFAAPADGQMVNISAILTDIAGNASPQGIDAARIDTTGPSNAGTGLVLDALTADNVVNAAEAGAAIPVTGRATGEFTPGDTVTVTVNGKAFSGTVGANGSFNISVPGADLIADGDRMLDATLRATDAAGNQADIGASRVYSVDTTATGAPVVSLGEDSNNNGILSPAELNGVIDVRISLPAGAVSGDILTVSNGTTTMPFTLTAAQIAAGFIDTSFAAPTEDGTIQVTAVLTDQAGNSSPQGSDSARLDTTATAAPTVTIAEDINNNGFINAAELAGQVDVRITLPAGTVAGDTLTVTDGTTQRTFTLTAAQVSAGQVLTDFPPPAEGQVLNVTATLRDMAGNTSAPGSDSAQLDTTGPSGAGTGVTLDPLTADNVINAAEAGGTVAVTGRATGEFAEGDRVTVTVNGKTFIGTVAANGNFSVNVPGADLAADVDKTLDASLRATDAAGNQAEITASRAYTADTTATGAPTVTITEDANNNAFISAAELSGDVGVRITLPAGAQLGDTLTVSDGTTTDRYVLNAAQLANGFIDTSFAAPTEGGTISVTATLTDVAGNTSAQGLDSARVDTTGPSGATTSITFASVTADNVVNAAESGGSVNVTGSVAGEFRQGDTITLTVNGKTFSGTLAANGSFNVAVPGSDLAADGDRRIDASLRATDAAGNQADISANKSYTVDTTALATPTVTITDDSANDGWITPGEFNGALDVRVSMPAGTSVGDVLSVSNGLTWQNITITQTHLNQGFVATSFSMAFSGSATASAYITDAAGNPSGTGTDSVTFYDPLVMDLDGDGVETLAISEGVNFDLNGDGVKDRTGWVGKDDGLLVADLDNSGTIDSGRELFGDATLKTDGSQAQHGFEALADMDSNQDGKISVADTGFNALKIWQDADSDGLTDTGELKSLTEMGVVEINLSHSTGNDKQSGNFITMESTYLKSDGSVLEISDVWLRNNSTAGATQGDEAGVVHIADFNPATGDALDLRDLLSAEQGMDLSTYLDFDTTSQPGSTVVHVSTTGQFANGEYTPGASDQTIVLDGVDLRSAMGLGANSSDSQLIQTLLNQGKLLTDGGV